MFEKINYNIKSEICGLNGTKVDSAECLIGGMAQHVLTNDGEKLCLLEQNKEPKLFIDKDLYKFKCCHVLKSGSQVGEFNSMLHNIDLVCIGDMNACFATLKALEQSQCKILSYSLDSKENIKNYLKIKNGAAIELFCFVVKYQLLTTLEELLNERI